MATLQPINVGAAANDGTGDPLRDAVMTMISNIGAVNTEVVDLARDFQGANTNQHFISAAYDATTEVLTFTRQDNTTMSVSLAQAPSAPVISELRLTDITSPINRSASLAGDHTFTYHVSAFSFVSSLIISVNGFQIDTVPNPTTDGRISGFFSISLGEWISIITGGTTNLDFQITGTDINLNPIASNTVRVVRIDDSDSNRVFYGLSDSNNADSIDTSTLSSHVILSASDVFDVDLGPTTNGQFVIFLVPQTETITELRNRRFSNHDVLSTFTKTVGVRTIDAQLFDAHVLGPVNGGFTLQYEVVL